MDKLISNSIEIQGTITLDKIRRIVNENFDENGKLKKKYPDVVIVDYMNKIK